MGYSMFGTSVANTNCVHCGNITTKVSGGVIFVIDSADKDRIQEARKELDSMLKDALLANVVVLILANKQDLPKAASPSALTDQLRLREFKQQWKVQGCCGTSGDGLYAGLDWLTDNMPTTTSGGESAKSK